MKIFRCLRALFWKEAVAGRVARTCSVGPRLLVANRGLRLLPIPAPFAMNVFAPKEANARSALDCGGCTPQTVGHKWKGGMNLSAISSQLLLGSSITRRLKHER
jgi:hypothetical protein